MSIKIGLIAAFLVVNFIVGVPFAVAQTSNADSAAIKAKVAELRGGGGTKVKVRYKDGREVKGVIDTVGDADFTLRDKKGDDLKIPYDQVAKVSKDTFPKGATIGIVAGVGVFAAIMLSFIIRRACNEGGC